MRKASVFLMIAALAVSLIACSQKTDESGVEESAAPPSSFSAGESSENPAVSEETAATKSVTTQTAETEQSTAAVATDKPQQPSGGISTAPPKTETQPPAAATSKPAEQNTEQPTPPKADPPATETPAPTEPPKPKTAYEAPYDTTAMIADAKAYGDSIGMTWSDPLTVDNCSWEAPIKTSSVLQGERLKAAIESGIRRVKKLQADNEYQPGEFHFKVFLEPTGGENFTIYFLMG